MANKELNERIEQYLLNKMEDIEREAFEDELKSDPELKELTVKKQLLINGIKAGFNAEFKSKLKSEDQHQKRMVKTRRIRFISGIAAILVIGIFSTFFLNSIKQNPTRIYEEYYQPYPNISTPLSRSDENGNSPYYQYEKGEYESALAGFQTLIKGNPDDESALFYAAISNMELSDFNNAIEKLKKVADKNQSKFTQAASWYLSLAYIHTKKPELASEYLNILAEGNDVYANNAKKILKKIN